MYSSDWFMINRYKILICSDRSERHCNWWRSCKFAHPQHNDLRRDFRHLYYSCERCPLFEAYGACPVGSECPFAHGDREVHFHPQFYRTRRCTRQPCTDQHCAFAHNDEEDRTAQVQQEQNHHYHLLINRLEQLRPTSFKIEAAQRSSSALGLYNPNPPRIDTNYNPSAQGSSSALGLYNPHLDQLCWNQPRFNYNHSVQRSSPALGLYNPQPFMSQPRIDTNSVGRSSSAVVHNPQHHFSCQPRIDITSVQGSSSAVLHNHHQHFQITLRPELGPIARPTRGQTTANSRVQQQHHHQQ